jgi:hypothetical protein
MGPKGRPDTKTNWSTDCQPHDELQLQVKKKHFGHCSQSVQLVSISTPAVIIIIV